MTFFSTRMRGRTAAAIDPPAPAGPPATRPALEARSAALDSAHIGDIVGAMGCISRHDTSQGRRAWRRLRMLPVIKGPVLIVTVGDNDAGGVATYSQAGPAHSAGLPAARRRVSHRQRHRNRNQLNCKGESVKAVL